MHTTTITSVPHDPPPDPGDGFRIDAPSNPNHSELAANLYVELRKIAATYFSSQPAGHTLQPTALVHEAVLRMIRSPQSRGADRWSSPGHFLAVAATAMRQILVDHARAKDSLKRGGRGGDGGRVGRGQVSIEAAGIAASPAFDVIELSDAIDRLALIDERAARVVMLRFFAGLTIAQSAEVLSISDYTVENDWRVARAFLARELASRDTDPEPRT